MKLIRSKMKPVLAVCVTDQRACERIIRAGAQLAEKNGYALRVVSIQGASAMNAEQCGVLEYLFSVSIAAGAEMTVLYSRDRHAALRRCLKHMSPAGIMLGAPRGRSELVASLREEFAAVPITMVDSEGRTHTLPMLDVRKHRMARATCLAY